MAIVFLEQVELLLFASLIATFNYLLRTNLALQFQVANQSSPHLVEDQAFIYYDFFEALVIILLDLLLLIHFKFHVEVLQAHSPTV